jgi:CheY-like chemotaxis protein/HPt (histidine-containing phosphotransfer) domain-containing protein
LRYYLEAEGAIVRMVEHGSQALLEDMSHFDLVLMDLQMPELDGYSTARALRQQGFRGPIIALTAYAAPADEVEVSKTGFTACLSKSASRAAIHASLAAYLPEMLEITKVPGNPSAVAACGLAGDPEYVELVQQYVKSLPNIVDEIRQAVLADDRWVMAKLVHRLIGTGTLYGLPALSQAAKGLHEDLCRQSPVATLAVHIDAIEAHVAHATRAIRPQGRG